jgi:hypothetical protein
LGVWGVLGGDARNRLWRDPVGKSSESAAGNAGLVAGVEVRRKIAIPTARAVSDAISDI